MAKFEVVSKYTDINLPIRQTEFSAGYDFEAAKDIVIPSFFRLMDSPTWQYVGSRRPATLKEIADLTKEYHMKPTLVPTGVKCKLANDEYLEIAVRSSCPLKHWLILGNGIGIIDSDYYNNPDNEGEIFFQIINLSPVDIEIKKGDRIGQGIIHKYITVEDDAAVGKRIGGTGSTDNVL